MRYYILLFLVILFAGPVAAQNETDEIIFKAMQDEMRRSQEQLVLPDMEKPFYISYSVARSRQFEVAGVLGGIINSTVSDWGTVCGAQLLLGDYQHTSDTRYVGQFSLIGSASELNYDMLRRSFWLLSDAVYKYSLQEDAAKKSYLKTNPLSPEIAALPEKPRLFASRASARAPSSSFTSVKGVSYTSIPAARAAMTILPRA